MSTGSTSAYVGACRKDIPYPSVSHESVPSLIDNLVSALYGTITKTVVNRRVVWNIPCDPNNTATINGIPRNAGEGLLCYIIRSLNLTTPSGFVTVDGIQTLTNKTLTAPVINSPIVSNLTGTGTLTGNASTATTLQTARTIALSGDVTGTATSFNGSANISIPVTINAGSVTPADLSTGGPSWNTSSELTAGRVIAHGNAGITTNNAFGLGTLASVTTGAKNTATGVSSLAANTTGQNNTGNGFESLKANTTGQGNSAFGEGSLRVNTIGSHNTAIGRIALAANTTASGNTAVGFLALQTNTIGSGNVAVGSSSLSASTTASFNTAIGQAALFQNDTGGYNTAVGQSAMLNNTTGSQNVAVGQLTMGASTGSFNVAVGNQALSNTDGSYNTVIGDSAGLNITTGNGNIVIGSKTSSGIYSPKLDLTTESNHIVMGSDAVTVARIQVAWTTTSDARDKTNINELGLGLDFVSQLKPVSFNLLLSRESGEPNGGIHYGFLAQDVLALEGENPVIIDNQNPEHLGYKESNLIPILVNAIKELKAEVEALKAKQ